MGIYDRDYIRQENRRGFNFGISACALIVIANVALYFANNASSDWLFSNMALFGQLSANPLHWYRCLTYGFAHDPNGYGHILGNMFTLYFLGRPVEMKYGKIEFLIFYLASILLGGVVWNILHAGSQAAALGASGGVCAVVILFALNFPRAMILVFGIIPCPAWALGVLYVLYDSFGARSGVGNVAHDVHLAGAAIAALYFALNVNFTTLSIGRGRAKKSLLGKKSRNIGEKYTSKSERKPSAPSRWSFGKKDAEKKEEIAFERLEAEVDRILFKIGESGEDSLTEAERETLRRASREYQKRQKGRG